MSPAYSSGRKTHKVVAMISLERILIHLLLNRKSGGEGGGNTVSLGNVVVLVADFSDTTSRTILDGAYYGTKRAIVS